MKFSCDKCNTRYSIADERVRGRVLKIRCKACNHVITVRENEGSGAEPMPEGPDAGGPPGGDDEHTRVSPPAGGAEAGAGADDWFVSFDGEQEGPLPLLRAIDRVKAERPRGRECYCWRAGFFVWLPVEEVPEFAPALGRSGPPPSPAQALTKPGRISGSHPIIKSTTPATPSGLKQAGGAEPAAKQATGSQPKLKQPSGSMPAVKQPTGSMPAVKQPTGSMPAVKQPTGSMPAVKQPTGSMPAAKQATGSMPAAKQPTGSQPAIKTQSLPAARSAGKAGAPAIPAAAAASGGKKPSAERPAVKASTGSQAALPSSGGGEPSLFDEPRPGELTRNMGADAPDLPPAPGTKPLNGAPLDVSMGNPPEASLPVQLTRPETRSAARKQDELALPGEPARPALMPLQTTGPTLVADAPTTVRPEPAGLVPPPDTGPVPLPPPPDDLPISEPSGLISLAHLVKPSMATPKIDARKPGVETFGGVPVQPSIPTPLATAAPIIVGTGAARGGAPWMKWAALAGALATVSLAIAVVVLMTRKPTVIVVPPAPTLDDGKKANDKVYTIDEGRGGPSNATASNDKQRQAPKKNPSPAARSAVSVKPPSETLSASQRNLASLYREDADHGTPREAPAINRGSAGGGGQVSQQAIMAVVTQNRRSLNLCYDRVLKHDSSLKSGRVVTHVKIGISGSVTGVSVPDPQYSGSEIGQCIAQTIKRWHFPSADAEYETEFPIILQAN
jgi:predicted Zn finger-like uncharacterized protein